METQPDFCWYFVRRTNTTGRPGGISPGYSKELSHVVLDLGRTRAGADRRPGMADPFPVQDVPSQNKIISKEQVMKVAVVTDDFKSISAHFGRAKHYQVFTIENDKITGQENRSKANHDHFAEAGHAHPEGAHGTDPASSHRHGMMMDTISDCQVLLARGMGMGARNALTSRGIQPILTEVEDIRAAVEAYIAGTLADHPERLH